MTADISYGTCENFGDFSFFDKRESIERELCKINKITIHILVHY